MKIKQATKLSQLKQLLQAHLKTRSSKLFNLLRRLMSLSKIKARIARKNLLVLPPLVLLRDTFQSKKSSHNMAQSTIASKSSEEAMASTTCFYQM